VCAHKTIPAPAALKSLFLNEKISLRALLLRHCELNLRDQRRNLVLKGDHAVLHLAHPSAEWVAAVFVRVHMYMCMCLCLCLCLCVCVCVCVCVEGEQGGVRQRVGLNMNSTCQQELPM
jgi:hypothetical protein